MRTESKGNKVKPPTGASMGGNQIKDEVGAVQMIKGMSRDEKVFLNEMVHSVLVNQTKNDETDILITTEKRMLIQAK